jgi:hypothetical protein
LKEVGASPFTPGARSQGIHELWPADFIQLAILDQAPEIDLLDSHLNLRSHLPRLACRQSSPDGPAELDLDDTRNRRGRLGPLQKGVDRMRPGQRTSERDGILTVMDRSCGTIKLASARNSNRGRRLSRRQIEDMMADMGRSFVPAELTGEHYRPIGGTYESQEKAMQATEQHFRNKHGGPGLFRVFKADDEHGVAAIVEAAPTNNDPMAIRAIYKILEQPSGR